MITHAYSKFLIIQEFPSKSSRQKKIKLPDQSANKFPKAKSDEEIFANYKSKQNKSKIIFKICTSNLYFYLNELRRLKTFKNNLFYELNKSEYINIFIARECLKNLKFSN